MRPVPPINSRLRWRGRAVCLLTCAAACVAGSYRAAAQDARQSLKISAAADLAPVMPGLAYLYEKKTGVRLDVTLGPSASETSRLEKGGKADLFLGADFTYPEKLVSDGLTDAKAPVAYAKNALVVFARKDSPLQPINLERLSDSRLHTLAVADPLRSPSGRAAASALTQLKLMDSTKGKLLVSDTSSAAAEMVERKQADLGLVSLTVANSKHNKEVGAFAIVPDSQYPQMRQYAVVLREGNTQAAHRFLDWLLSSEVQDQLPAAGLSSLH